MNLDGPVGPPLNEKEAAAALGVSRPTLQRAVDAGVIPAPLRVSHLKLYPRPIIWALVNGIKPPNEDSPLLSYPEKLA